jgi:putative ABC transport system ATP-binding protein
MSAVVAALDTPRTVRVERVNHHYGEGVSRNQVLFDNCLEVEAGQLVIMTGPSGSGKTTLISLIGALRSVQDGRIQILEGDLTGLSRQELVAMRRNLGFIFQAHNLFDSLSAYENVKMALQLGDCAPGEMRQRGTHMLERLGLGHRVDYKPRSLSGGQRQRVAVARALVNRPKLVLADEPTASLDKESSATVVNLLKELTVNEGCTVIMVTHDNRILELADRIVNMIDGKIISNVVLRKTLIICEFLKSVELFKQLTPSEIANIADRMQTRKYNSGDVVIRQDDPGEEFYLIGRGGAAVLTQVAGGGEHRVATLAPGDVFGEMALLTDEPRHATVQALEELEVYCLSKQDFREALERSIGFKEQIRQIYFDRYPVLRKVRHGGSEHISGGPGSVSIPAS